MTALLHVFRRAYNLSVEAFRAGTVPSSELRKRIVDQLREEHPDHHNYDLVAEAYRKAVIARAAVIARRRKKQSAELHFMSWKYSPRHFVLMKFRAQFLRSIVGETRYAEDIPEEALLKCTNVVLEDGEWYACLQRHTTIAPPVEGVRRMVALDPGVRTFQTSFSEDRATKYGEGFAAAKLVPLMLRVRQLVATRARLENAAKVVRAEHGKEAPLPQWLGDRFRAVGRRLDRVRARRQHLVGDLHRRVAYDLVQSYDVILLPTFAVSQMVKRERTRDDTGENQARKTRRKTVQTMMDLQHYRFKLHLRRMALKYGKTNEAYTSKTLWDGTAPGTSSSGRSLSAV